MLMNRIYDETDLARYRAERAAESLVWQERFQTLGVHEDLVDVFVKQQLDKTVRAPQLAGVEIVHTGFQADQHFSTSLVTDFIRLGIMEIQGKELILHATPEDLYYTILREPGRWCLHCGEKLSDDANGELARLHVALKHKDAPSPDPNQPAGYEWLTYFDCVLDEGQHANYRKGA